MAALYSQNADDEESDEYKDSDDEKYIETLPDMTYSSDEIRWQANLRFAMDNIAEQKAKKKREDRLLLHTTTEDERLQMARKAKADHIKKEKARIKKLRKQRRRALRGYSDSESDSDSEKEPVKTEEELIQEQETILSDLLYRYRRDQYDGSNSDRDVDREDIMARDDTLFQMWYKASIMKVQPEEVVPDYIVQQFRKLYFRHMDPDLFPKGKGELIDTSDPKIRYKPGKIKYLSKT